MIAKSGFELGFSKPSANLEIEAQKHLSLSDFVQNPRCEYQGIRAAIVSKRTVARPKHGLSPASVSTWLVRDAAPRYCFGASH
ncbi:hypothetical protein HETIRDRAFT_409824 [Heterobasidion irregulare TC 32-1]|uniref:Uncharacterized protein n=1 Tax=Heterobasidion irregulare (strain TC 32-1) TaxID=747525 RepID=W4K3H8_HETIT|nr:uncharacterized protein HETIRDRAFT_409824 [Heterobasidion irregulare TC 32-1]ETW80279.1 hypothetical protein HETIRDRAFT_409824 [Heterobasidion irregulare TC 32-1]